MLTPGTTSRRPTRTDRTVDPRSPRRAPARRRSGQCCQHCRLQRPAVDLHLWPLHSRADVNTNVVVRLFGPPKTGTGDNQHVLFSQRQSGLFGKIVTKGNGWLAEIRFAQLKQRPLGLPNSDDFSRKCSTDTVGASRRRPATCARNGPDTAERSVAALTRLRIEYPKFFSSQPRQCRDELRRVQASRADRSIAGLAGFDKGQHILRSCEPWSACVGTTPSKPLSAERTQTGLLSTRQLAVPTVSNEHRGVGLDA